MERKDKIAGSILGLIVGDILASPLKTFSYEERKKFLPVNNLVEPFAVNTIIEEGTIKGSDLTNRIQSWFPAGFYSFYGQQTLLVFDSIVKIQDVDIEDISQRLVKYSFPRDRITPFGIYRGYHRKFYDAVQNIANGLPLKVCGVTNCYGDAAFKSIPIALFCGNEVKTMSEKSLDITMLTNRDVTSVASASAIGYTIAQASTKSFFNIDDELHRIIDFTRMSEDYSVKRYSDFLSESAHNKNIVSSALNELYSLKDKPIEDGVHFFKKFASEHNMKHNSSVVTTGVSLLLFFKNIGSFEYTVKNSLELDIDIDIITPLVAAISGSLLGIDKIPKHWKKLVNGRKDIILKSEFLKNEAEKPAFKNYFIREIEFTNQQLDIKDEALNKAEEKTLELTAR